MIFFFSRIEGQANCEIFSNLTGQEKLLFSVLKIIDVDPPTQHEEKPKQTKVGERHLNRKAWHAHVWSSSDNDEYRDSDD